MRGASLALLLLLCSGCPREITPSACAECHTLAKSKNHMLTNGGKFNEAAGEWLPPNPTEVCSRCHSPGKTLDVEVAHAKSPRFQQ